MNFSMILLALRIGFEVLDVLERGVELKSF
jgi:hypothetical protein